jgi:aerobic-type carbon monoxide dehydrogenase small subunit (CoxS/CutS family)
MKIQFELNGHLIATDQSPGMTLLEFLRQEQELFSVKHGCDRGECGACTVLVNDLAMNACLLLIHRLEGTKVETLESMSSHSSLTPLQESFLAEGAVQCGFCTPGMELSIEALRRERSSIDEASVRDALAGNLCRCTGYVKPVAAALKSLEGESS